MCQTRWQKSQCTVVLARFYIISQTAETESNVGFSNCGKLYSHMWKTHALISRISFSICDKRLFVSVTLNHKLISLSYSMLFHVNIKKVWSHQPSFVRSNHFASAPVTPAPLDPRISKGANGPGECRWCLRASFSCSRATHAFSCRDAACAKSARLTAPLAYGQKASPLATPWHKW